jgi:hypothetical protein
MAHRRVQHLTGGAVKISIKLPIGAWPILYVATLGTVPLMRVYSRRRSVVRGSPRIGSLLAFFCRGDDGLRIRALGRSVEPKVDLVLATEEGLPRWSTRALTHVVETTGVVAKRVWVLLGKVKEERGEWVKSGRGSGGGGREGRLATNLPHQHCRRSTRR